MKKLALMWLSYLAPVVSIILFLGAPDSVHTAEFFCAFGDVTCLIAAINDANQNGEENTINLAPGTYTLTSIDNGAPAPENNNGLPVITSAMTINGQTAETTIIERDPLAPSFRILQISGAGKLLIEALTIRGGSLPVFTSPSSGGGIRNLGALTVINSIIERSVANVGGGINNAGEAEIISSTVTNNASNVTGGFANQGTAIIHNSTISDNSAESVSGVSNGGTMIISNTTVSGNRASFPPAFGGGIFNNGDLKILNSTISRNRAAASGGITNSGKVELQNTIVALNTLAPPSSFAGPDCFGPIISLGNNIIGDLSGCDINLLPTDLTGDPGLDAFVDDGAPGHGRFPLLATSQAVNTANDSACSPTDQLDTPRRGPCDIGAIEFYPVVNELVALASVSKAFDSTPMPGGPAGTFHITANFTNTSNQAIVNPFAEVVDLTGENLLLNADGGAGGIGARLKQTDSGTTIFQPGTSITFEFLIGLQRQEAFTFFVNMLGDPRSSNQSVSIR